MNENQLQASVFAEIDLRAKQDSQWKHIFAVPNGQYRPGQRMEPGLKPGVPDVIVLLPRRGYHGMAMELKVNDNDTTEAQKQWLMRLANAGYCACIVRNDPAEALRILEWYLGANE